MPPDYSTSALSNVTTRPTGSGVLAVPRRPSRPPASVVHDISTLTPSPAGAKGLVFLTSHGARQRWLRYCRRRAADAGGVLDQALSDGQGRADRGDRLSLFLGAIRDRADDPPQPDHPDRGAGFRRLLSSRAADATFTYFDECLLGAPAQCLGLAGRLRADRAAASTSGEQRSARCRRSRRRCSVRGRGLPAPAAAAGDAGLIVFIPGPGHYAPSLVPWGRRTRQRLRASLAGYAEAPSPKAMALLPDGLAVWTSRDPRWRDRSADEQSGTWSGALRVRPRRRLLALRPRRPQRRLLLPSGRYRCIRRSRRATAGLDPAAVPSSGRINRPLVAQYLAQTKPRALAQISLDQAASP